jgi:D-glycero-alpha-D-manno-heptose-7-phosphate kinase
VRYTARAPLRIDFAGGWTDTPIYSQREGGAVLNAAVTRYATGSISRPQAEGVLGLLRGDRSYLSFSVDVPAGAGLGTSAAQTVLWVTLVKTAIANVSDRREIAAMACQVAAAMGIVGGKQDEYAAALGGIGFYTFTDTVECERLHLPLQVEEELLRRLVLVYTGQRRLSSDIHERVWNRFKAGEPAVAQALHNLKEIAVTMRAALLVPDFTAFGQLLNANWENQKRLHPSVSNPLLDDIVEFALRRGAVGSKACGAGGGGCLLFLGASEAAAEHLKTELRGRRLRVIDFAFDTYGVYLSKG